MVVPWMTKEEDFHTADMFATLQIVPPETCHACSGSGKRYEQDWDDRRIWNAYTCKQCQGKGWLDGYIFRQ